jgi:hypothetical protein
MSGIKKLVQADNKGLAQVTNEDLKDESTENPTSKEEVSEKK